MKTKKLDKLLWVVTLPDTKPVNSPVILFFSSFCSLNYNNNNNINGCHSVMITKQMPTTASNGFFMITCDQLQQEEKSTRHIITLQDFLTNSVSLIVETSL